MKKAHLILAALAACIVVGCGKDDAEPPPSEEAMRNSPKYDTGTGKTDSPQAPKSNDGPPVSDQ